ncbi:MAG: LytTR family DNA-binding domain-containing protein [Bacteroidia bacterium]
MIKAVIVDDEPKSRDVLHSLLEKYCPEVSIIGEAQDVITAKELIETQHPDVVFLDVEMPGGSGFRLLDQFPAPAFDVIFVTSYGHYAIPALRYSAVDYLLKPVDISELKDAVQRARSRIQSREEISNKLRNLSSNLGAEHVGAKKIAVSSASDVKFIKADDIVRMEADSNYTVIYKANGDKIIASRTLKDFEELLFDNPAFIRTHKKHLVNINYVVKFNKNEGGELVLKDGSRIEVSRRKKQEVLEKLEKN